MKTLKIEQIVLPHSHPLDPAKAVWVITTDGVPGLAYYLTEAKAKEMLARKLDSEAKADIRKDAVRGLRESVVMGDWCMEG